MNNSSSERPVRVFYPDEYWEPPDAEDSSHEAVSVSNGTGNSNSRVGETGDEEDIVDYFLNLPAEVPSSSPALSPSSKFYSPSPTIRPRRRMQYARYHPRYDYQHHNQSQDLELDEHDRPAHAHAHAQSPDECPSSTDFATAKASPSRVNRTLFALANTNNNYSNTDTNFHPSSSSKTSSCSGSNTECQQYHEESKGWTPSCEGSQHECASCSASCACSQPNPPPSQLFDFDSDALHSFIRPLHPLNTNSTADGSPRSNYSPKSSVSTASKARPFPHLQHLTLPDSPSPAALSLSDLDELQPPCHHSFCQTCSASPRHSHIPPIHPHPHPCLVREEKSQVGVTRERSTRARRCHPTNVDEHKQQWVNRGQDPALARVDYALHLQQWTRNGQIRRPPNSPANAHFESVHPSTRSINQDFPPHARYVQACGHTNPQLAALQLSPEEEDDGEDYAYGFGGRFDDLRLDFDLDSDDPRLDPDFDVDFDVDDEAKSGYPSNAVGADGNVIAEGGVMRSAEQRQELASPACCRSDYILEEGLSSGSDPDAASSPYRQTVAANITDSHQPCCTNARVHTYDQHSHGHNHDHDSHSDPSHDHRGARFPCQQRHPQRRPQRQRQRRFQPTLTRSASLFDDWKVKTSPMEDISFEDIKFGDKIGEGSFGEVYVGTLYGQEVALKIMRLKGNAADMRSFAKEVKMMRHLRHPNIVEFLGAAVSYPTLCIVTEYLDSGSIHNVMEKMQKEGRRFSLKQVISLAKDVARGLNWLHHKGIIHRDLKPANVLLDRGGRAKLADFGLSHIKRREEDSDGWYGVCGTLCYMAPEVLKKQRYGFAADVFSFGVVLCELLTGRYPFDGVDVPQSTADFEMAIVSGLRPTIPEDCPPALRELIEWCLKDDPKERPTMQQVMEKLVDVERTLDKSSSLIDECPVEVQRLFEEEKRIKEELQEKIRKQRGLLREMDTLLKKVQLDCTRERQRRKLAEEALVKAKRVMMVRGLISGVPPPAKPGLRSHHPYSTTHLQSLPLTTSHSGSSSLHFTPTLPSFTPLTSAQSHFSAPSSPLPSTREWISPPLTHCDMTSTPFSTALSTPFSAAKQTGLGLGSNLGAVSTLGLPTVSASPSPSSSPSQSPSKSPSQSPSKSPFRSLHPSPPSGTYRRHSVPFIVSPYQFYRPARHDLDLSASTSAPQQQHDLPMKMQLIDNPPQQQTQLISSTSSSTNHSLAAWTTRAKNETSPQVHERGRSDQHSGNSIIDSPRDLGLSHKPAEMESTRDSDNVNAVSAPSSTIFPLVSVGEKPQLEGPWHTPVGCDSEAETKPMIKE